MGKDRGREFSDGLPRIDRVMAVAYALIFVTVPFVTFFVGQRLDHLLLFSALPPFPFNLVVGLAVFLFGLAVGIKSTRLLYLIGRGLPWGEAEGEARSTKLVTTGLYASCRNPMTLGYSLLPCGMGIMFRSLSMTFIIPSVVFSAMIVWLKVWEEPRLEKRFGEAYREYQRRTPFLIPNFRLLLMDLAGSAPRLRKPALKRWQLACIVAVVVVVLGVVAYALLKGSPPNREPLHYTYRVVNEYPHDAGAFTQGLVFDGDVLYEGTGLYGESSLRHVDLESGKVLQSYDLSDEFFGEGITVVDDKIVQLTWRSNVGFVYDKHSFDLLQDFSYPTEGWGVTYDGSRLIMSDGSANLYFLDPVSFERVGEVEVRDVELGAVARLNELEYVDGHVYANIWYDERIVVVNPSSGQVVKWIDLGGLRDLAGPGADVLNGIAYDVEGGRLFVTGKRWSKLFEIELILSD